MSFKTHAMNVVTLGGHAQLEAAKAEYAAAYERYQRSSARLYWLEHKTDGRVAELGQLVMLSFKAATSARRLLRYAGRSQHSEPSVTRVSLSARTDSMNLTTVDRVIADYSASTAVIGSAGAGAAAVAGSWSLVAVIGSASTGTAISTLSGAAATNATLAWFGGGALAAGGAGMAGGTMVLGGLALAPVVAVAAWHSRAKTNEINREAEKVRAADAEVQGAMPRAHEALRLVDARIDAVRPPADMLHAELAAARATLFPVRLWSFGIRWVRRLIGRPFYSPQETAVVDALEAKLIEFVDCFRGLSNGGDTQKL